MLFLTILLSGPQAGLAARRSTTDPDSTSEKTSSIELPIPSIGYLFQVDGYAESQLFEQGFVVRSARVIASGKAGRFSYFAQVNLITEPSLLDTRLRVALTDELGLEAGLVKTPFSAEFNTFRGHLPLSEPSRIVIALAPKRQIGATLKAVVGSTSIRGGLYNGNGRVLQNDGAGLMGVARLEQVMKIGGPEIQGELQLGVNGAYSRDQDVFLPGFSSSYAGSRLIGGMDARFSTGRILASAEVNVAEFSPDSAGIDIDNLFPWGFALTAGYAFPSGHSLTGRIDFLDRDLEPIGDYVLVGGYAFEPIRGARISAEYRFNMTDSRTSEVLIRFQLARK